MTFTETGFLVAGMAIGFFIAVVWASTKFWELHTRAEKLAHRVILLEQEISHYRQLASPFDWTDEGPMNMKVRRQLYNKYEALIEPGTEVVRITEEGDMPDLPDGWREKVGDE